MLDVTDDRTALGPGTIAKYDHELRAFDALDLDDVVRDAALTFVLDFVRANGRARRPGPRSEELGDLWPTVAPRLAAYVGDDFQLAPQAATPTPSRVRGLPPSRAKAPRGKPPRVAGARRSR